MPENRHATRLPSSGDARPLWARALDTFYGECFDVRSRRDLAESMAEFVELPPGEQAFHQAHLAFRQVQGLADVHATLRRIEGLLGALPVSALKHLGPMRRALEEIADAQAEVLEALEEREEEVDGEEVDGEEEAIEVDAEEEPVTWDPPAEVPVQPEVVVPEVVEAPPTDVAAPRKPRRSRVIDVPGSEAA